MISRIVFGLLFAAAAYAQPFVFYRGVVNAGSFLPPGLPNGSIARGSMFSIFGRGLGPTTPQQVSAFPLQTAFAGVSVELTQGATKVNALPVYVSAGQLNVIMPSNTPLGAVSLRVIYNSQPGNPVRVNIAASSVGLFSVNGGGFGPGIVQNFVSDLNRPINSLTATARPGQVEILWGTGLGAAPFADNIAPPAQNIGTPLELYVGGKRASVSYAGRSPCCSSIDQIVFEVPADAPAGCYVPVVVRTNGTVVSNTVTMAIHPTGAPCADAHNPLNSQRSGGNLAVMQLARENVRVDVGVPLPYDVTLDHFMAAFRTASPSEFYFSALTAPPPLGTCTVYSGSADRLVSNDSALGLPGSQTSLGSPLKVESGSNSVDIANDPGFAGAFYALLGADGPGFTAPLLLNNGPFTLSSSTLRAVVDRVATALNWTNRDQITTVDRSKDLTLTWTGTPGQGRGVLIVGASARIPENAASGFVCLASPGVNSFTVPTYVLAALPATAGKDTFASTQISLVNVPLTSSGGLPGVDAAFLGFSQWSSKTAKTK